MFNPLPDRRYDIIYADPPWQYRDKSRNRIGAEGHYRTVAIADLKKLPVWDIAAPSSVLLMWATWPTMPDALDLIGRWGFAYKTCAFVWVKINPKGDVFTGGGHYTRSNSEVVLLATKGEVLPRQSRSIGQIIEGNAEVIKVPHPRRGGRIVHSAKPAIVRDRITDLFGEVARIELFARTAAPGWDCWGDQAPEAIS